MSIDVARARAERLRERLESLPGVQVRDKGTRRCGIVSFTPGNKSPEEVQAAMTERGINMSVTSVTSTQLDMHDHRIDSMVRAGMHYYNTEEEIGTLVSALKEVL